MFFYAQLCWKVNIMHSSRFAWITNMAFYVDYQVACETEAATGKEQLRLSYNATYSGFRLVTELSFNTFNCL